MVAVGGCLEFTCSFNDDPVLAHQPPDTPMTDIDPNLLQLFGHSWPAIAAKTQARLFLDMGQNDHVCVLPAAGRAAAKGPQTARADVHELAQPLCWERPNVFFDKPKPHGFWLAKNWVAFVGKTVPRTVF